MYKNRVSISGLRRPSARQYQNRRIADERAGYENTLFLSTGEIRHFSSM